MWIVLQYLQSYSATKENNLTPLLRPDKRTFQTVKVFYFFIYFKAIFMFRKYVVTFKQ